MLLTNLSLKTRIKPFAIWSFVLIFSFLSSCKREEKRWNTDILTPLFRTSLGIDDLIPDSLLIKASDSSYILSYDYEVKIDSFGDYLYIPDTVNRVTVSLQKLILSDKALTDTVTLREMSPPAGLLDGKTVQLPVQDIKDAGGGQEIDITKEFFKTAKFRSGFLDLGIHNDLPVEVETMSFMLTNKVDGSIVAQGVFSDILPNDSAFKSIDLSGKTVDGILIGKIDQVKTKASNGPVLIDADKGVRISMNVRDLEPEYATAIFPAQDLVTDTQEVKYNLGGAEITEMMIRSGRVTMTVHSTIEEEIKLDYRIPFSGKNGDFNNPLVKIISIPPAKPGTTVKVQESFPLNQYVIVYKGKDPLNPPYTNTVYSELVASIVYSGIERSIALTDSVFIEFGFVDIVPDYVYGDLGYKEFDLKEKTDINVFDKFDGDVNFEDMWMSVLFENAFGIEANLDINSIKGTNNRTGKQVNLSRAGLIGETVFLAKAFNPPLTPYRKNFVLNPSNSNVKSFLENLPDQIETDLHIVSRPNGTYNLTDFIFYTSYLKAILRLNLPLHFSMGNMRLTQKQKFDFNALQNNEQIKEATLHLKVDNDFPLQAIIELEFLDDNDILLLTAFQEDNVIEAAQVDPVTEKTYQSVNSHLVFELNAAQLDLLRSSKKVRIKATFDTPGVSRYKLFSHYKLNTSLTADLVYEQRYE